jgi:S-adenosylmethionine synthetase
MVGRHVTSLADYQEKKTAVQSVALRAARNAVGADADVEVVVNAADGDSPESLYLTVTGLSAEAGDDGQVGRGNRANGLITPYRPMSLEAVAGKNPVSHVGKLYNLLANRIAQAVVIELEAVEQAECYLLSQIGHSIEDPQLLDVKIRLRDPETSPAVQNRVGEIARDHLSGVSSLWRELIRE